MRKVNIIAIILTLITFLIHAVSASLLMFGVSHVLLKPISRACFVFVGVHAVISGILTVKTLIACKRSGASYFRQNGLFWARRISGFALLIFMVLHLVWGLGLISGETLNTFSLTLNIMLVITLALHIILNAKPMILSFGVSRLKGSIGTIWVVTSLILLLASVAFVFLFVLGGGA